MRAASAIYGMIKTTVYITDELDVHLDAEPAASGLAKLS